MTLFNCLLWVLCWNDVEYIYPCHVNYTEKTSLCIALTSEEPYSAGVIAKCDGRSDAGMDVTRGSMRRNRSVIEIVPATKN